MAVLKKFILIEDSLEKRWINHWNFTSYNWDHYCINIVLWDQSFFHWLRGYSNWVSMVFKHKNYLVGMGRFYICIFEASRNPFLLKYSYKVANKRYLKVKWHKNGVTSPSVLTSSQRFKQYVKLIETIFKMAIICT